MLITDLSEKEILDFMTRTHLPRLACAKDGQPYIVPIFCAYQNDCVRHTALHALRSLRVSV
jgi:nitroimidazol reductase NimA-like FMN-containing flavoprotein (pyridoxamine 5'-phosphate oxidase superfamily)